MESDYKWFPVLVGLVPGPEGTLIVNDPHIGHIGLDAYHDGLTDLEWLKL